MLNEKLEKFPVEEHPPSQEPSSVSEDLFSLLLVSSPCKLDFKKILKFTFEAVESFHVFAHFVNISVGRLQEDERSVLWWYKRAFMMPPATRHHRVSVFISSKDFYMRLQPVKCLLHR